MGMALPGSPPCPKLLRGWGLHFGTTRFGVRQRGWCPVPPQAPQPGEPRHDPGGCLAEALSPGKPSASTFPSPPSRGGSGELGVRSPMGSAGRRRPDACARPACPLHRIPRRQWQEKSATFLETFFKADQRCWEATAKQQQLLMPVPPPRLGPPVPGWAPPGCLRGPWQSWVLPWQPLGTVVAEAG